MDMINMAAKQVTILLAVRRDLEIKEIKEITPIFVPL